MMIEVLTNNQNILRQLKAGKKDIMRDMMLKLKFPKDILLQKISYNSKPLCLRVNLVFKTYNNWEEICNKDNNKFHQSF